MEQTDSVALAVRRGNAETAVPRLLAMLCILAVFIPSFFMQGAARALFVPLSLAVGFAMIASYLLSSTFVPVLSRLAAAARTSRRRHARRDASFDRLRGALSPALLGVADALRWVVVPAYLVAARRRDLAGRRGGSARRSSRRWTPASSSSGCGPRRHAHRADRGDRPARRCELIERGGRPGERRDLRSATSASSRRAIPINTVYQWMGGPEEAVLRVALKRGAVRVEELKERLREKLPATCGVDGGSGREGVPADVAERRAGPAAVVRAGRHRQRGDELRLADAGRGRRSAARTWPTTAPTPRRSAASWRRSPSLRDLQFGQSLDYPTVEVNVDREKAGLAGVDAGGRRAGRWSRPRRRAASSCRTTGRPEDAASATRCRSRSRRAR